MQLALTVGMVTCIHFIEAYVLNPGAPAKHACPAHVVAIRVAVSRKHRMLSSRMIIYPDGCCVLVHAAIYSAHLKLHPLLVLSVLVIAEHSLGVWGLLLAGMVSAQDCHCLVLRFSIPYSCVKLQATAQHFFHKTSCCSRHSSLCNTC